MIRGKQDRKTMEYTISDKELAMAIRIEAFLLSASFICAGTGILLLKERELYLFINAILLVSILLFGCCAADMWRKWIVLEKCDFEAQEACILKLLRKKRYRGRAGVHLGMLQTSLILGKYGQSRQELEELYRLRGRLNRKQMLQLYLFHIDHMLSVNEPAQLKSVAEAAESALDRLGRLKDRERKKIQAGIMLRRYLAEQKWEEALASLEDIKRLSKNATVFEQMSTAYVRGRCCYQLSRYKEACEALNFAAKWGGNTKYVALAKDMLQKIGQQNLCSTGPAARPKKIRHQMGQKGLLMAIDGIFIVLFGVLSVLCSRGGSVEEAYGRRYLCDRSGLTVLYRESIDPYELAVLMDGDRISYCLLSKEPGSSYRVRDSFCMDMSF